MANKNELITLIKNTTDMKVYEACMLQIVQEGYFNKNCIRSPIIQLFKKYDWLYDKCCEQFINNIEWAKDEGSFIRYGFHNVLSLNKIVDLSSLIKTKNKESIQELIYWCMRRNDKIEHCNSQKFFDYYCNEKIMEWLNDIHTPIILKCFYHYLSPEQELACLQAFEEDELCHLINEKHFKYYKEKAQSMYFMHKIGICD